MPRALGRRVTQARLSLAWEAIWPSVSPVVGIVGIFAGIALLEGFSYLPGWLHTVFPCPLRQSCLGMPSIAAYGPLVWPNHHDAVRRIEIASGLEHRPLEALQDTLPEGMTDPTSRALWAAHQHQTAERVRSLKVGVPSPGLPARDPWALRAAVALLLVVGIVVAGPDGGDRLGRALVPQFGESGGAQTAKLELWVTPPEHTRLPPIFPIQIARDHARFLATPAATASTDGKVSPIAAELEIEVPEGSVLTAIVFGRPRRRGARYRWRENTA